MAGKFHLKRLLGEGGMGWVWVARHEELQVDVAIKLIRHDVSVPAAEQRLLTEARALARLDHPGIVHVVDYGRTERDDPFIAMELLEGEDLAEVLEREERLSPTKALKILLPVAEALGVAHARGIVHRDLKPDNIYLSHTDGRVHPKVIDFGIAKLDLESKHTQAGVALGSPDYMAPEQARGQRDVDHRADIWAFCILVYEAVTGHVPFEDASYNAVLRHVIESPIPPLFEHGVDEPELWEILSRGFEKNRDQRYQHVREVGVALASWLMDRGVTEDVTGSSLRSVWFSAPRKSLVTIPEVDLAIIHASRLETTSSIPPISETGQHPIGVRRSRMLALLGAAAVLVVVLVLIAVGHKTAPAAVSDAPASRTPPHRAPAKAATPSPPAEAAPAADAKPSAAASVEPPPAASSAAPKPVRRRPPPKAVQHSYRPSPARWKPQPAPQPKAPAPNPPPGDELGF